MKAVKKRYVYTIQNNVIHYLTKDIDLGKVELYTILNDYGMAMYFFEKAIELGCIGLNNMTKALEHFDKALEYGDLRVLNYMTKFVSETRHEKLFDIFKMIFERDRDHDHCVELYTMIWKNYNKMICWKMLFM